MKFCRILGKSFSDSLKGIIREYSLSLATIWSITITLMVVAVAMIVSYNVDNFSHTLKEDMTIVVFLPSNYTEDEAIAFEGLLLDIDNVNKSEIVFVSKNQMAQDMIGESEELGAIISNWGEDENPLLHSYIVKVEDVELIKDTSDKIAIIDEEIVTKYGEGMVEQLVVVFKVVEQAAVVMVVALILVTAFLIGNTIKLTIYSRKREIEIMRLVGASNFVINMPFIIEGMILGILGSILPIALIVYGYSEFYDFFNGQLFSPIISLVQPAPFVYIVSFIMVFIAVVVGSFGSIRAVRRYLKI